MAYYRETALGKTRRVNESKWSLTGRFFHTKNEKESDNKTRFCIGAIYGIRRIRMKKFYERFGGSRLVLFFFFYRYCADENSFDFSERIRFIWPRISMIKTSKLGFRPTLPCVPSIDFFHFAFLIITYSTIQSRFHRVRWGKQTNWFFESENVWQRKSSSVSGGRI